VLLAAGPAALLVQLARPLVAAAVARHSGFPRDSFQRLRATLEAVLAMSFGDDRQIEQAAARVAARHRVVRGALPRPAGPFPAGHPYRADDPELALWVHATLVFSALEAYEVLVAPLARAERSRYWQEVKPFARLFGVTDAIMPVDHPAFQAYLEAMIGGGTLVVGEEARQLAIPILDPPVPWVLRPAVAATRLITVGLLPDSLRRQFGLAWDRRRRERYGALCRAVRVVLPGLPPAVRYWPHYRVAMERVAGT